MVRADGRDACNNSSRGNCCRGRALLLVSAGGSVRSQTDPLPSWNEGATKQAILDFVKTRDDEGAPDFVAAGRAHRDIRQRRHAVVRAADLFPVAFALDRVKALAPQHPEWKTKQPFDALLEGDMKARWPGRKGHASSHGGDAQPA